MSADGDGDKNRRDTSRYSLEAIFPETASAPQSDGAGDGGGANPATPDAAQPAAPKTAGTAEASATPPGTGQAGAPQAGAAQPRPRPSVVASGSEGKSAPFIASASRAEPPAAPPPPAARAFGPPNARETAARWPVRSALLLGLIGILLLVGGFGAWAYASRIAGAVVASGQVEVQSQRQIVQHPDGGVVEEILVKEGDTVEAGQPLLRLDGALLRTELTIVEGQYFEILARRGRLEAERADADDIVFPEDLVASAADRPDLTALMEGQRSLFVARRDTIRQSLDRLGQQTEQVGAQIRGIDAQSEALSRQQGFIDEELTDQRSLLERGLAQAPRVLALEREAAGLAGQLGEMEASRAQAETRQTEIGIEQLRLAAERRETAEAELRDLAYRELELAERRRSLTEQIARLEIRAPVSGIVLDMQVTTPRSVIRPADPILYIIPQDRPLLVGVRIATINIDELQIGQAVQLRFSAFSSRTTPEIEGVLSRIAADATIDERTQSPFYRADVTIPPDQIEKLGENVLVPGMPAEVFIQTGERSPLTYLLKPLADYFSRAFRET